MEDIEEFVIKKCQWMLRITEEGIEYRISSGQRWMLNPTCYECPFELERMMADE